MGRSQLLLEKHKFREQLAVAQPHWTQAALKSTECLSPLLLSQGLCCSGSQLYQQDFILHSVS